MKQYLKKIENTSIVLMLIGCVGHRFLHFSWAIWVCIAADLKLQRVLQKYDKHTETVKTVESLPAGARFTLKNGLVFQKGEKQRTRYKCFCESNGRWYFVAALAEVKKTE